MTRLALWLALAACTSSAASNQQRGPVATTPRALFDDFTRPEADGPALLDKYATGATFTATIKTVGRDEHGAPIVWIDVDGDNLMVLELAAPAPHTLGPGARLTFTCRIGGASGALMMMTSCVVSNV